MNGWTFEQIIALIGLIVGVISCVAAILAIPWLKQLMGFSAKDVWISTPRNKDKIPISYGEKMPIVRPVTGEVSGFSAKEIERLGLFVELWIETDRWYLQGSANVENDGKWVLKEAKFGGFRHIIKAILKDKRGHEYKNTEIEATVIKRS